MGLDQPQQFDRAGDLERRVRAVRGSLKAYFVRRVLRKRFWSNLTDEEQDIIIAAESGE